MEKLRKEADFLAIFVIKRIPVNNSIPIIVRAKIGAALQPIIPSEIKLSSKGSIGNNFATPEKTNTAPTKTCSI